MIPVILSGGAGTRLWPLSRGMYPKQLLPLVHETSSMLQQTLRRAQSITGALDPIVVCNEEHRFIIAEQVAQLHIKASIILEPAPRNTAPAIAIAAWQAVNTHQDPTLLVLPADHKIENEAAFEVAVLKGLELSKAGKLVTFGINPTRPETGYGYIKAGGSLLNGFAVDKFHEKPNLDQAKVYIEEGDHYWNAGIFIFNAHTLLAELEEHAPQIYEATRRSSNAARLDLDFIRVEKESFETSPSNSIDFAVMEQTSRAATVPVSCGWSDVGSWAALWDVLDKDETGNVTHGDVVKQSTENSLIYAESKLVATLGIKNLTIVQTEDAVLVADSSQSQNIKSLVEALKKQSRSQTRHHRKVYRPWGWYDSIDVGEGFQVKRILVNPGAKLSVQLHHKRAEHWVVVSGTAEVLLGERVMTLSENESTYIPIGTKHSLRNPSDVQALEIIEVQTGSYLGEDDIIRFEDNYGRADS